MKLFKYFSIMVLSLAIYFVMMIFTSCNESHQQSNLNDPSSSILLEKSVPKERFENPQKKIGEMHNEALDAVFLAIKKNSAKIRCIDDLINTAQKGMNEYWLNKKVFIDDQAIKKAFEKKDTKSIIIPKERFLKTLSDEGMTDKQLTFIDDYYSLLNKKLSVNDLKDTIASMNMKAMKEFGETDAKHILAFSSLAENSYEYHSKRSIEWMELVKSLPIEGIKGKNLSKTTMDEINWDVFWQADLGAFPGALFSCADTIIFGQYGTCVAAYTAMSSCMALLIEILLFFLSLLI